MNRFFIKFICLIFILSLFPLANLLAQSTGTGNFLELSLNPVNPEPGQNVTATIDSVRFDVNKAKVTWLVNDQIKSSGTGLKQFSFIVGKNGERTTIRAVVVPSGGTELFAEQTFIPSVVDLIYEAISYTPPFYKGRALNPNQGVVIVVAIPNLVSTEGVKISTKNLIYSWKKDGKADQGASGLGKNTYTFSGGVPIRDSVIEVNVSSIDSSIFATKKVTVVNSSPKIIFYENSPIYGLMFNKAIKNSVNLLADEFSTVAVPYFFSAGYMTTPDLDYVWNFNGQNVSNQEPKNTFTVRQTMPGSGTANISLKINNNLRIFQYTDAGYTVNFQK